MWPPVSVQYLTILFGFLLSVAIAETQFSFPSFSPESRDDVLAIGDAAYDIANRSYILNAGARTLASRGSCAALFYGKAVRIQNVATESVASFSTSFSFAFTKHDLPRDYSKKASEGIGFVFALITKSHVAILNDMFSQPGNVGGCSKVPLQTQIDTLTRPSFDVSFEAEYIPNLKRSISELSNNFILVGKNLEYEYDLETYTHNLCGNDKHCSYFSNGRILTAWIDFNSSSQTLEIRMANCCRLQASIRPRIALCSNSCSGITISCGLMNAVCKRNSRLNKFSSN